MKKDRNRTKNTDEKLLSRHKKILEAINNGNDFYEIYDQFNITGNDIKFWRETISDFDKQYLKAIGLTRSQELFLENYSKKLLNISATCKAVGISRDTFYRWSDTSDTFRRFLNEISEEIKDNVETIIFEKIFVEKNNKFIWAFAESKMADRGYGKTPQIINQNSNSIYNEYYGKSIEELDIEIAKLEEQLNRS